jgi:MinD-like ATPase involved in chromosome partitioning or flagellar assembly
MSLATPVICFYSFKGGAGRTVCTANFTSVFARMIGASEEAPVLLADMDLDSAGMTMMMNCAEKVGPYTSAGLVAGTVNLNNIDLCKELFAAGFHDISRTLHTDARSVLFLATDVAPRDSALMDEVGQNYLHYLIGHCEDRGFRAVIVDSASGSQDSALVCQLEANVVICCCRMTNQFYYGTRKHLEALNAAHPSDNRTIVLLPVAVPTPSKRFEKVFDGSVSRLEQIVYDLQQNGVRIELFNPGICEVELFKWQESVLKGKEQDADAIQAANRFKDLAARVIQIVKPETGSRGGA